MAPKRRRTGSSPTPSPITVTLSVNPSTATPGATVSATWTVSGTPSQKDWIVLVPTTATLGGGNVAQYPWQYTNGQHFGTYSVQAPNPAGTYEFRYYQNDGFTLAARSNPVIITVTQATNCSQYTNTSQIPTGFGVPWDVRNPSIMLISASCSGSTLRLKAGTQNVSPIRYIYKTAYSTASGASSWTPFDMFGSNLISGAWYQTSAQGVTTIDQSTPTYAVAYTCTWNGSAWKCGCRDSACTQSYWQIQKIHQ